MKVMRKAAADPKMSLSDDTEDAKNMVDVPVLGENLSDGKENLGFNYNGENPEDRPRDEDEEDNEDEADDEGEDEFEGEGLEEEEEEEEGPKLDEGFFEIEAIRRKRSRKGQLQYLIKWRGWPETSNTWEPLENLMSCSDVIDAFEESLRYGKSSRKRKRKHGGLHILPKKKQQLSSTGLNLTALEISEIDKTFSTPVSNSSLAGGHSGSGQEGENNGNDSVTKTDENGHSNESKQNFGNKKDNEYDPKLSELKGTLPINDANQDKLAVHFGEGDGLTNEVPKFDYADPVQNNKPCTGSKRRKSGSVKRFKKDLAIYQPASEQSSPIFVQPPPLNVTVGLDGEAAPLGIENGNLSGANSSYKPVGDNSLVITKIIKPIGFSASVMDHTQDVLVSFLALRSDGKEVEVDNKFLKLNNPHLLIDFYEQHLKYNT